MSTLISDDKLACAMEALPGKRVTAEAIQQRIKAVDFIDAPGCAPTLTICNIALDNGYSVRGESACVDPANYKQEIGRKLAYEDAIRKLWPLFGFLLAEWRYQQGKTVLPAASEERETNP